MWSNAQPVALERALGPGAEQPGRHRERGTIFGQASQDAPWAKHGKDGQTGK